MARASQDRPLVATEPVRETSGAMQRRDPRHDILFEPVQIGPKRLRNRFYQVPHCSGFGEVKPFSQAEHRATKAEGGWAAVSTEYAPVSTRVGREPGGRRPHVGLGRRRQPRAHVRPGPRVRLARRDRAESLGRPRAMCGEARVPSMAPSQLASDFIHNIVPKTMDLDDIARIRRDWVEAAKRARDVGFDIVYVYGGHSYLPMQFLSGFYNHRTDGYGGSFERRARFWLELLTDVREAVGNDCAIANRIAVAALGPAGVELDESLRFIAAADDLVDLWDVNVGSISEWSKDSGASRFFREGYQLEWTGGLKEATRKPVVGVGRLTEPGPHGRHRAARGLGPHRRRAPFDRRPVPAEEDRGGALRRDPRVHRLQRLRFEGRDHGPPRVYPERHRRRGVPARLAPGALQQGGERRSRRSRGRRRAGGPRVRHHARKARR